MGQGTPSKEVVSAGLGDQRQPDPMGVGGPPEQEKPRGSPTTDKGWSPRPLSICPWPWLPLHGGHRPSPGTRPEAGLGSPAQGRFLEEGRL